MSIKKLSMLLSVTDIIMETTKKTWNMHIKKTWNMHIYGGMNINNMEHAY